MFRGVEADSDNMFNIMWAHLRTVKKEIPGPVLVSSTSVRGAGNVQTVVSFD